MSVVKFSMVSTVGGRLGSGRLKTASMLFLDVGVLLRKTPPKPLRVCFFTAASLRPEAADFFATGFFAVGFVVFFGPVLDFTLAMIILLAAFAAHLFAAIVSSTKSALL